MMRKRRRKNFFESIHFALTAKIQSCDCGETCGLPLIWQCRNPINKCVREIWKSWLWQVQLQHGEGEGRMKGTFCFYIGKKDVFFVQIMHRQKLSKTARGGGGGGAAVLSGRAGRGSLPSPVPPPPPGPPCSFWLRLRLANLASQAR